MIKRWIAAASVFVVCLLSACRADPDILLQNGGAAAISEVGEEQNDVSEQDVGEDSQGETEEEPKSTDQTAQTADIYVYVCGAVNAAGVYELPVGSRAYEAVEKAGGMRDDAAVDAVNLAEVLSDGQKLKIPAQGEAVSDGSDAQGSSSSGALTADEKVNINAATAEELMTLSGIGQTRAAEIIAYREKHGSFSAPEDIMNVDGIKQGTYDKIKDNITVQ